jgi:hypothetical protein
MTNETRSFIEPEDFLGVEFECGHCHARFLYKLSEEVSRIIFNCPNCNEPFYKPDLKGNFEQFFSLLKNMHGLTAGSKLKIRLQITQSAARKSELEP